MYDTLAQIRQEDEAKARKLHSDIDKLWACWNAMKLDFIQFGQHINQADGSSRFSPCGESSYRVALEELDRLEDAIKRFRNGELQAWQIVVQKELVKAS